MTQFSETQLSELREDGFTVIPRLFMLEETQLLLEHLRTRPKLRVGNSLGPLDCDRKTTRIDFWTKDSDPLMNLVPRLPRIAEPIIQYYGHPEIYIWRIFVNYKQPLIGGSWAWHQDYVGWRKIAPEAQPLFLSCHIALTECTKESSCLSFAKGANKRVLEHRKIEGSNQIGICSQVISEILNDAEETSVELQIGDAVFFDSLVPHRSGPNLSEKERWTFACVYNTLNNRSTNCTNSRLLLASDRELLANT